HPGRRAAARVARILGTLCPYPGPGAGPAAAAARLRAHRTMPGPGPQAGLSAPLGGADLWRTSMGSGGALALPRTRADPRAGGGGIAMIDLGHVTLMLLAAGVGAWIWRGLGLRDRALRMVRQHCQR